jgi:hypothetical protein
VSKRQGEWLKEIEKQRSKGGKLEPIKPFTWKQPVVPPKTPHDDSRGLALNSKAREPKKDDSARERPDIAELRAEVAAKMRKHRRV